MASTLTNNFMRGEDLALRMFSTGAAEIFLNHVSFTITQDATEGSDDICGQKTGLPWLVHNFWVVDFSGLIADTKAVVDDWLANVVAKAANTGENPAVVSFKATTKTAVSRLYTFTGVTRRPLKLSVNARTDAKIDTGFRCTQWKSA